MITYEEALRIAQGLKSKKITRCVEEEKAYIFCVDLPPEIEDACGGEYSSCVVYKEDGRTCGMAAHVMSGNTTDTIREFEVE